MHTYPWNKLRDRNLLLRMFNKSIRLPPPTDALFQDLPPDQRRQFWDAYKAAWSPFTCKFPEVPSSQGMNSSTPNDSTSSASGSATRSLQPPSRLTICSICGATIQNLSRHQSRSCPGTARQRFLCDVPGCKGSFSRADNLRRHERECHGL